MITENWSLSPREAEQSLPLQNLSIYTDFLILWKFIDKPLFLVPE